MFMNEKLHYSIVGLGISGISCLEFLIENNIANITATDIKDNEELRCLIDKYPKVKFFLGELFIPEETDFIILSPGIDQFIPIIKNAVLNGATLTNDVNVFLKQLNILKKFKDIKVVVITGTNGKTTVVNMLADMAEQSGIKYALCGNVGNPVLNYLPNINNINENYDQLPELYIIELSSFQLELVDELHCDVASILNITPDHLDRYPDFDAYCVAKLKVYLHAKHCVYYQEDLHTHSNRPGISFGKNYVPDKHSYSIDPDNLWLMQGALKMLPIKELGLNSEHNILNALAAIAIGDLLDFSRENIYTVLKNFKGLEYRYQTVGNFKDHIWWINDSKGTNVGATLAAINTTAHSNQYNNKNIIIIMGGLNKNVDLSLLKPLVITYCKMAILIGECKEQLLNIFQDHLECYLAIDLQVAVNIAKKFGHQGDIVLFSPACASFDMFDNYKHRGDVFKQCVLSLYHEQKH